MHSRTYVFSRDASVARKTWLHGGRPRVNSVSTPKAYRMGGHGWGRDRGRRKNPKVDHNPPCGVLQSSFWWSAFLGVWGLFFVRQKKRDNCSRVRKKRIGFNTTPGGMGTGGLRSMWSNPTVTTFAVQIRPLDFCFVCRARFQRNKKNGVPSVARAQLYSLTVLQSYSLAVL